MPAGYYCANKNVTRRRAPQPEPPESSSNLAGKPNCPSGVSGGAARRREGSMTEAALHGFSRCASDPGRLLGKLVKVHTNLSLESRSV